MHEISDLEKELKMKALAIQKDIEKRGLGSPPVIIIVGGINEKITQTEFASVGCKRLREFLGILESAKQIATLRHFADSPSPIIRRDIGKLLSFLLKRRE
jgi:hypothetical protein